MCGSTHPFFLFFFFLPSVVVISNRVGFPLFFFFFKHSWECFRGKLEQRVGNSCADGTDF